MALIINGQISKRQLVYGARPYDGRPTASVPADDPESEYGPFVASEYRPLFHRPDCKWASCINSKSKIRFTSHSETVKAGKKP